MKMRRVSLPILLGLSSIFAAAPSIAKADTITATFTATASGTIGTNTFSSVLVTVTAIGDTSNVFQAPQPPFPYPNIFEFIPSQFDVTIPGVGTADFTGDGFWGGGQSGGGYVFDNQPSGGVAGFGIESDNSDTYNPAFATYNLQSSIGPISDVEIFFTDEATSLGPLTLTPTTETPGTFTEVVDTSAVPEPGSLALFSTGFAILGAICFWQQRRHQPIGS